MTPVEREYSQASASPSGHEISMPDGKAFFHGVIVMPLSARNSGDVNHRHTALKTSERIGLINSLTDPAKIGICQLTAD
jgi:hypothetical protein